MARRRKKEDPFEAIVVAMGYFTLGGLIYTYIFQRDNFFIVGLLLAFAWAAALYTIFRISRAKNVKWFNSRKTLDSLKGMTPNDFEEYIAELYRKMGYKSEKVGQSHDGGIDVVATDKEGIKHYIQCKKFITSKVGVSQVRDFYGAVMGKQFDGKGIFITTNIFTTEAEQFAEDKPIELIDGQKLTRIVQNTGSIELASSGDKEVLCPECGGHLVARSGKFGQFLGCSTYPKCKYTQSLS